jgi:hypothetical protein
MPTHQDSPILRESRLASRNLGELPSVVITLSTAARQEVIEDEIGDVVTEPVPGRQVVAKMDASENAALSGRIAVQRDDHIMSRRIGRGVL